ENEGTTDKQKSRYLKTHSPKDTRKPSSEKIGRTKIGRPLEDTSGKPPTGTVSTNITLPIDSTEELDAEKWDLNGKRKLYISTSPTSVEISKERCPSLSPLKSPGRHSDSWSTSPQLPKISRVTNRPIPVVDPLSVVDPL